MFPVSFSGGLSNQGDCPVHTTKQSSSCRGWGGVDQTLLLEGSGPATGLDPACPAPARGGGPPAGPRGPADRAIFVRDASNCQMQQDLLESQAQEKLQEPNACWFQLTWVMS